MTERKQTGLFGLTRCHLWTDHYPVCLSISCLSHIYDLCKARAVTSRTIKMPPRSAAELSQLLHSSTHRPRCQSIHQSLMVALVNYAKNVLERPAILKLLVLGLFRPFDKIKFSIDRSFQKCIIVAKAFWNNSENSTFILTSLKKCLFAMNRQGPKW